MRWTGLRLKVCEVSVWGMNWGGLVWRKSGGTALEERVDKSE